MSEYTVTLTEAERAAILEWLLNVDREAEYPGLYDRLAATPAAEPGALERLEAWLTANPDALPELCRSYSAETDTTDFGIINGELMYGFGPTLAAAIDAFLLWDDRP